MKLREHIGHGGVTLSLEGNFDETASPEIDKKLDDLFSKPAQDIRFDFDRVKYISSAGIRVLIVAHKKAVKNGRRILIDKMSPQVREVLETVGILSLFAAPGGGADAAKI